MTLEQECINSGTLPSTAYGFKRCSLKHKIGTQDKYCNNYPPCKAVWASGQRVHKYVGYDVGETRRIQHASPAGCNGQKVRKALSALRVELDQRGLYPRDRAGRTSEARGKSSCFFCPNMKKLEIQALWEDHPDLFQRAVELEHRSAANNRSVKGLGRNWSWESYRQQFLQEKSLEAAQITLDELFPDSPGGCLCGAPCGCYDG